jgi:Cu-Zn family superoxide dismutase
MHGKIFATLTAAVALLTGCSTIGIGGGDSGVIAKTELRSPGGSAKGSAALVAAGSGLELRIEVSGLPPGRHGLHLHAVGRCAPPDFASAGPHLNPHGKMHGIDNPQGSHLGDLPNLPVGAKGKARLTIPLAGSRAELEPLLFDADGTAVVIHASADDYRTDPSGNSGGRIACGVFTRR